MSSAGSTALIFADIVAESSGSLLNLSFLGFVTFGHSVAASRDSAHSPTRVVVDQIQELCQRSGLLRAGMPLSPAGLVHWLQVSSLPTGVVCLYEMGAGLDRREQCLRNRHNLVYGSVGQKEHILAKLVSTSPLKSSFPFLNTVLGIGPSVTDVRTAIMRLVKGVSGMPPADASSLAVLENLEPQLQNLLPVLTEPSLMGATLSQRVTAVIKARDEQGGLHHTGVGSSSTTAAGACTSVNRIKAAVFADELATAMGSPSWRATEAALSAELLLPQPDPLRIYDLIINSSVMRARRLVLGQVEPTLAAVVNRSKPLASALNEVEDFRLLASQFLVRDLVTFQTADANLKMFRLSERVVAALRRGAFNEIDWVVDILLPVESAKSPNLELEDYAQGLFDPRVMPLLDPLLQRVSRLLGLPTQPPPTSPGPAPPIFSSLSTTAATVASEHLDITARPSPFNDDYLEKLRLFESTAWHEAAVEFNVRVTHARNLTAAPPLSVLPADSAARSILAEMRTVKAHHRQTVKDNKTHYALLADYRKGLLGGRFDLRASVRDRTATHVPPARAAPQEQRRLTSSSARLPLPSPSGLSDLQVIPGSRYDDLIRHSNDGSAFWFVSPATGARVSSVYSYALLEQLAGRTRRELDFPFLLSVMPPAKRWLSVSTVTNRHIELRCQPLTCLLSLSLSPRSTPIITYPKTPLLLMRNWICKSIGLPTERGAAVPPTHKMPDAHTATDLPNPVLVLLRARALRRSCVKQRSIKTRLHLPFRSLSRRVPIFLILR